jgi:hypothetical protein
MLPSDKDNPLTKAYYSIQVPFPHPRTHTSQQLIPPRNHETLVYVHPLCTRGAHTNTTPRRSSNHTHTHHHTSAKNSVLGEKYLRFSPLPTQHNPLRSIYLSYRSIQRHTHSASNSSRTSTYTSLCASVSASAANLSASNPESAICPPLPAASSLPAASLLALIPPPNASGTFSLRLIATNDFGSLTLHRISKSYSSPCARLNSRMELRPQRVEHFLPVMMRRETATRREANHVPRVELAARC